LQYRVAGKVSVTRPLIGVVVRRASKCTSFAHFSRQGADQQCDALKEKMSQHWLQNKNARPIVSNKSKNVAVASFAFAFTGGSNKRTRILAA
jgi:hypothetical protein